MLEAAFGTVTDAIQVARITGDSANSSFPSLVNRSDAPINRNPIAKAHGKFVRYERINIFIFYIQVYS